MEGTYGGVHWGTGMTGSHEGGMGGHMGGWGTTGTQAQRKVSKCHRGELRDSRRPQALPQYQLHKPQRSIWGQKTPPPRDLKNNPDLSLLSLQGAPLQLRVYLLDRFAIIIIIVTACKNTFIVSKAQNVAQA